MNSENQDRDKLEKLMRERAEKAQENIKRIHDLQSSEQEVFDLSQAGQKLLKYPAGPEIDLNKLIVDWQLANNQASRFSDQLGSLASTASGLTFGMTQFLGTDYSCLPQPLREAAKASQVELGIVINRPPHRKEVHDLVKEFGLDKAMPRQKSVLQQFETAWAAYDRPVTSDSPINTSLLPIREAIESTISELLRHRPKQESTKNLKEKIISIGNQLARDGILTDSIQGWASKWQDLQNKLSGSKNEDLSRSEWHKLLLEATLFLKELLLGLDISKFKK
jgi:hypothetical protein